MDNTTHETSSIERKGIMVNLTTKELSAIEDQLTQENLMVKKYQAASQMAQDQVLKTKFDAIACKHQDHFNTLFTYLQ